MLGQHALNSVIKEFIPANVRENMVRVPYFWNLNNVYVKGDTLFAMGWALQHGGIDDGTQILVNGNKPETIKFTDVKEVALLYPWWPNALHSEFVLSINVECLQLDEVSELEFRSVPAWDLNVDIPSYRSFFLRLSDLNAIYPDEVIQARIGHENSFHYALLGRTLYRHFDFALKRFSGRCISEMNQIVDWGCGSGRIARYLVEDLTENQEFAGIDIDEPAVEWANVNIGKNFETCYKTPPLPYESASKELVYSYSVFTHLPEDILKLWIAEIARIIQPGGYFLFTILSDTAMLGLLQYKNEAFCKEWESKGIFDSQANDQLSSIGVEGDYYRNVWLSQKYIEEHWRSYFEIVSIEQNFHFYQDLVVCRRLK